MRVRIVRPFVEGWSVYNPGQELDVDAGRGVQLLQQGVAERLEGIPETATLPQRGEKAVRSIPPRPTR